LKSQAALAAGAHADRVQLQRGHAVVVHQLPQLRQVLHQRRDDLARSADVGQCVGDDESFQARQRVERNRGDLVLAELLDVDAAAVRDGDGGRPEARVVGDREVDLVLGRHAAFEADAIGLGDDVAVAVLGEVQALLLGERLRQRGGTPDEPGLALLADRAPEQRLDEHLAMAPDQVLDLVLAGIRAEHFGRWEVDVLQQRRAVQQSGELHGCVPFRRPGAGGAGEGPAVTRLSGKATIARRSFREAFNPGRGSCRHGDRYRSGWPSSVVGRP
jgi:hypothetical protein